MDSNTIGVCITAFLSFLALALGVFWGLHSFTKGIGAKIDKVEESIITQMSGIKETITRIDERASNLLQLAQANLFKGSSQTVSGVLKNFGKTSVSAQLAANQTVYLIQVEKGEINAGTIIRLGKKTNLARTEIEMFGGETQVFNLTPQRLRMAVPSIDPVICKKYMSFFLQWLDNEYSAESESEVQTYEEGIKF